MGNRTKAVESNRQRAESTPTSISTPNSESQLLEVAAECHREEDSLTHNAVAIESVALTHQRPADAVAQNQPQLAYSPEEAARVIGVELKTIEYLMKSRKLAWVRLGSQRRLVILREDLENYLKERRLPTAKEEMEKRKRV